MIVPDINLLIYATYKDSPHHAKAWSWLEGILNGDEPVGLPWTSVLGFIRVTTNARIMSQPWTVNDAMATVSEWYARRIVTPVDPGADHWRILSSLLTDAGRGANLITDAHLAALCIERGATLHTADGDFSRFRGLRWCNPLTQL